MKQQIINKIDDNKYCTAIKRRGYIIPVDQVLKNTSAGIPSSSCNILAVCKVNGFFPCSMAETCPFEPILPTRSLPFSPFSIITNFITEIGSGFGMGKWISS